MQMKPCTAVAEVHIVGEDILLVFAAGQFQKQQLLTQASFVGGQWRALGLQGPVNHAHGQQVGVHSIDQRLFPQRLAQPLHGRETCQGTEMLILFGLQDQIDAAGTAQLLVDQFKRLAQ